MDVVLCWHMHQPDYRLEGRYLKPWTWLHAVKDYTDMAAHLESVPGARAVVNFSPVLIEQLQDYPKRIRGRLESDDRVGDRLLDALCDEYVPSEPELLSQLLRVNEERVNPRFEVYARLFDHARADPGNLGAAERSDLLVWYVIAWLGESLRDRPLVKALAEKASGFEHADRLELAALVSEVIDGILPRYRALAEAGTVELSVTPYAHPILPLLLDFESALDAMPHAPLPAGSYPGGEDRCHWHLGEAKRVFRETFGTEPAGCWPSEGALSQATLRLLGRHDFRWTASGSQVLHNTLRRAGEDVSGLSQLDIFQSPENGTPACFFRDDGLSDLIGFEYSKWPASDAVDDLIAHLENRREAYAEAGQVRPVVSIIMDGENAWEYFRENGWAFLRGLYARLVEHPDLQLTTFSEVIENSEARPLPELSAGSWVHGSFSTWIGEAAKNRAWELLCEARRALDAALANSEDDKPPEWAGPALRQLAICEASDWSWWLSEENPMRDSPEFDALYRRQLAELYRLLGTEPPEILSRAIGGSERSHGSEPEDVAGAMRRSRETPQPDRFGG